MEYIVQSVNDLVVSFDSIQVFGVGLWTWFLVSIFVVFIATFVLLPIIAMIWPGLGWFE